MPSLFGIYIILSCKLVMMCPRPCLIIKTLVITVWIGKSMCLEFEAFWTNLETSCSKFTENAWKMYIHLKFFGFRTFGIDLHVINLQCLLCHHLRDVFFVMSNLACE